MSEYPQIEIYVAPPTYAYQPPEIQIVEDQPPTEVEQVQPEPVTKSAMAALGDELDHPSVSVPFLLQFQKSYKKVEDLGNSLKGTSLGLGTFGVVCFGIAAYSFMTNSFSAMQQSAAIIDQSHKKLSAGLDDMSVASLLDQVTQNASISSISSTFSMLMWGLVMAKARTGFTAGASKDSATVSSSYGKMIGLGLLAVVAGLAKLNADSHYVENIVENVKSEVSSFGMSLNLLQTKAPSVPSSEDLLASLNELWHSQKMQVQSESVEITDESEVTVAEPKKQLKSEEPIDFGSVFSKVGAYLSFIVLGGFCVGYFSVFNQYKVALAQHEKMVALLNTPNARVAAGEQIQKVTEHLSAMQQKVEAKKQEDALQRILTTQYKTVVATPNKVLGQTFAITPKKEKAQFQYSLCDSIDYQTESLLGKQSNTYSLEQVTQMLNQQKAELLKSQVPQPTVAMQGPPKVVATLTQPTKPAQQKVVVMTKQQFEKMYGKVPTAPVVADNEAVNASMTLTQTNLMA